MPATTIRSTLLSLIGALGAVILLLVAVQLTDLNRVRKQAEQQLAANVARNQVVRAALALARERDAQFLALGLGRPVRPETAVQTDRSFAAFGVGKTPAAHGEADTASIQFAMTAERLPAMRAAAAVALDLPMLSDQRQDATLRWFDDASQAVSELFALRVRLLSESDIIGPELFGLYYLRTQTLTLLDELLKNAAMLEVDVARQSALGSGGLSMRELTDAPGINGAASVISLSVGQFADVLSSLGNQGLGPGMTLFDAETYAAAEQNLRTALKSGEAIPEAVAYWRRVSNAAILELDELQAATFRVTQDRTSDIARQARRSILAWSLVLFASAGIVVVAAKVVIAWVVLPLERMRDAMLQLAEDNLAVELPKQSKLKEVDAMEDALRVFKANGMRRQSLQRERLQLHGRLEETYRHLKIDLEAAAVIQASLLPQQAQLGGVSLSSYFRPSHFLAGDTFDVLQQPDGRVIVFQIDVAGHGAAAALVSVASKYTVAQAILQRRPGADLAALTQEINREWPSDLPYFTLVIAEIDPATGQGVLVQAGHPSPMLLLASGELIILGDGGLPVGVLANATYEAVPFAFGPNDRLMIATDGMHEMANQGGELFSEERVQDLMRVSAGKSTEQILTALDTSLRAWRGDDTLDDDVTIVMLEGKRASEYQRGSERGPDHPEAGRTAA